MRRFLFTFRRPVSSPNGRPRLTWVYSTAWFKVGSDNQARARASKIVQKTRIQFRGAYSVGMAIVLHGFDSRGRATVIDLSDKP